MSARGGSPAHGSGQDWPAGAARGAPDALVHRGQDTGTERSADAIRPIRSAYDTLDTPCGLVVDEALAAGLPVISTNPAGEIRERIVDGLNEYLIPPDGPEALVAAMRSLVVDPAIGHQVGAGSAEMIAQGCTLAPERDGNALRSGARRDFTP